MWVVQVIYLLQADCVGLGFTVLTQVELLVKLLGQVAVTALSKQRDFSMELHSSLKHILKQRETGRMNMYCMNEKILNTTQMMKSSLYVEDHNIWYYLT